MRFSRTRFKWAQIGLFLGISSSFGCSNLPELESGVCGNYVIDSGEDCDQHFDEPFVCAGAEQPNACHYVCTIHDSECPPGFGCGRDRVCRRALGVFLSESEAEGFVWPTSIQTGDFDSDGNGDLLLLGPPDSFGYRASRALFSQGFTLRSGLSVLPTELANPTVGAGNGAGDRRDIVFADLEGVALLRGYSDRTADFTVFPTIALPQGTHARITMADVLGSRPGDEVVALATSPMGSSAILGVDFGEFPTNLVNVPNGAEALVERRGYFTGRFDEMGACVHIVIAYRDASNVNLFTPCTPSGNWNAGGMLRSVALKPAVNLDRGVIGADIDSDGHLDLVIGAGNRTYVAYGLGDGQFTSQKMNGILGEAAPYVLPLVAGGTEGFPLAIADLNADGQMDFVMPDGLVVSQGVDYDYTFRNLGAPWTEALVANLNGNELPDVAAIVEGNLDIQFLNNAGGGVFGAATLPTEGPPAHLNTGDFDGDLLNDLVFSEAIAERGEIEDHLAFAFGSPFGSPEIPVATGEVGKLGQIITGYSAGPSGADPMSEVGVVVEGAEGLRDNIAVLMGRASRAIFSTLPLRSSQSKHIPISFAFGNYGDDTPDIAALAASATDGSLSLFRIDAFEEEGLTIPDASGALPSNFIPSEMSQALGLRHGAMVVATDLDNDTIDEALVVGSYVERDQAAFALAKFDPISSRFVIVDAQVFSGQITVDSKIFIDDLDGDGASDLVLTTGYVPEPSDLIIVWGTASNKLPDLNQNLERVRVESLGIKAVAALRSRNGNGKMLIASTLHKTYLLELTLEHSWRYVEVPEIPSARAFGVVDFDRDGVEDIAAQLDGGLELFRSIAK